MPGERQQGLYNNIKLQRYSKRTEGSKKEKVRVYQFLREPIIQYFGADFYEALEAAAEHILGPER